MTPETKVPAASITVNNVGNTKANEATFDQMLGGAKFKLASDAAGTNFVKGADGKDMEVTADANGLATFAGVPYTAAIGNTYYLVETQAPVGYQLKGASIKVELQKDQDKEFTQTVLVKHYIAGSTDPDNPKFKLPLTGGAETMVFTIGGLMLIGLAATLGCLYYKKR
ncbi:SpaA isopeptide-forming pilin-related protein [Eubacterium aggregans]|uniref:SpaA isopeptide-forming pilin-related protein n=1 Tax=Eubacterium aggregans TaxID=81409 RepID=UPI003F382977